MMTIKPYFCRLGIVFLCAGVSLSALAEAVQGVALTRSGYIIAPLLGKEGDSVQVEQGGAFQPGKVVVTDSRYRVSLIKADGKFSSISLANTKIIEGTEDVCTLVVRDSVPKCVVAQSHAMATHARGG